MSDPPIASLSPVSVAKQAPDVDTTEAPDEAGHSAGHGQGIGTLALGALGVVFGDIGTSPLYAFREAFEHQHLPGRADQRPGRWRRSPSGR